ncbi:MAG: S-adenosyl-l-methionine hydroxide adenosyltransferase family protein [Acidimicrobiia bacterium]
MSDFEAADDGVAFTITVLTDTGPGELAGVLESIARDIAPHAAVVHLTHDVEPYDVRGGSLALARAIGYVASGVVVAAVDPDTDRPIVAVELAGASGVLIGPDNGLLAPAVAMAGGAGRAFVLDNADYHLESPGSVLAVRDVMMSAAAHLACGVPLEVLGTSVDTSNLLPGILPITRSEADALAAEVLWVDRYGAIQLNVGTDELETNAGDRVLIRFGDTARTALVTTSVRGLGESQLALVPDAYGLMSLRLCRGSAAADLGLGVADAVSLTVVGPGNAPGLDGSFPDMTGGTITPVQLRR